MPDKIPDSDLKALIANPDSYLSNASNRAKVLQLHPDELNSQLRAYAARNNLAASGLIKEIVKSLITQALD